MGERFGGGRLVFVATAASAPTSASGTRAIVLDTAWVPGPDAPPDLVALRAAAAPVLERVDFYGHALTLLDAWADATEMADRMTADGVSWWFRVREGLWTWLHERLIWRAILAELAQAGPLQEVVVPVDEIALGDVARALAVAGGTAVTFAGEPSPGAHPASAAAIPNRGLLQRAAPSLARLGRRTQPTAPHDPHGRLVELDRRVQSLARLNPSTLVLSHMGLRQRVGSRDAERVTDPNLGAVIDRLRGEGRNPIVIGLGLDHRAESDWAAIEVDPWLLPASLLYGRWASSDDPAPPVDRLVDALAPVASIPLDVDGVDLAPALVDEARSVVTGTIATALRQLPRARRLLEELDPSAILLSHEGIRPGWLIAAREAGIPTIAVQHGVIYPTHPGYRHPRHRGLVLPTVTCVFGPFERDVLLQHGGYRPAEVEVSGSPRLALDPRAGTDPDALMADRAAVRRELGIADGDRMLVVSTVFVPFVQRFYYAQMLDRILGGPLPGVHVVFKLHPGETDDGPYRTILEGMASARRYAPPPISVVQDVDLYRLLRAADAHLGLSSTVLTDAVMAGTPNLISVAQAHADLLGYVPALVARPVRDVAELRLALAEPWPPDPSARQAFIDAHFRAGDAAARIAATIRRQVVSIRPASPADEGLLLAWANDPEARKGSGGRPEIPSDIHAAWFAERLDDRSSYRIWIGEVGDAAVGVIRFERRDVQCVEVSITVAPEARGRGFAGPLLRAGLDAAREAFDRPRVLARVWPDNRRSLRLFEGAGFQRTTGVGSGSGPIRLERDA